MTDKPELTPKERFERAIRREEVDRLPFWVKIFGASYMDFQEHKYRDMPELEMAEYLDLDHMTGGPAPVRGHNSGVTIRTEKQNGKQITTIETPDGVLRAVNSFDEGSRSWHPTEFPIKTVDDLRAMRHRYANTRYEFNPELLAKGKDRLKQVGDRAIVMTGIGISPLMEIIQHLVGPENTYYLMADHPKEMDDLIEQMHQDRLRFVRVAAEHAPFDYIVSTENTSTTLLSPSIFERYCWRHLNEYGKIITRHGKMHVLHQCGKLKAVLPKIDELPAACIEAYTSPPVGDTTLADRTALAPHTSVIGGTNATLWLAPVDTICETIRRDLAAAGGMRGVVLTSAGVMPPAAAIPKIAKVREAMKGIRWGDFDR
ncbi:MAG: uroporphyrinogen decarboxylase family protein [Planctomycetota bacterium]